MDPADAQLAERVRLGLAAGSGDSIRLLLVPYLHWVRPDGTVVRGRTRVLADMAADGALEPPAAVELRDGQIYRWVSPPA
ncbi:hypothetical protein [Diaminobutyricibacter sp. McL0608]|uniref:hypothetical protein n=1 Tax=Leifsonia sp. McL0608 TaxID=3143537 RepID=UPI0031F31D5E